MDCFLWYKLTSVPDYSKSYDLYQRFFRTQITQIVLLRKPFSAFFDYIPWIWQYYFCKFFANQVTILKYKAPFVICKPFSIQWTQISLSDRSSMHHIISLLFWHSQKRFFATESSGLTPRCESFLQALSSLYCNGVFVVKVVADIGV